MNFSIIGTGFIMPRHAEAIYYVGGKIRDVVNTARGENAWREMVKTTDADCIVILTPNDLHYEMAIEAARASKIVLCEKPLALKANHIRLLTSWPNIFTVLQLRHHPLAKQLKSEIKPTEKYEVEMDISVHRDPPYYESWKGKHSRSGGILFNIGSHYFDMLIHLLGYPKKILGVSGDEKNMTGVLQGENYECRWKMSTDEPRETQRRVFKINGVDYNFSSQDNLSYENLHREVYKDLLNGKGIMPQEALKSVELVENLIRS